MLHKPSCFLLFIRFLYLNLIAYSTSDEQFVFDDFARANLSLDGMATVMSNGLLRLTNGTYQMTGHAFYPIPLRFRKSPNGTVRSFTTTFVFVIMSKEIDVSTHGLAFVIAPTKNLSTAFFGGCLGLVNVKDNGNTSNHIFAVELDTLQNADFQDIDNNHVGIDVNSVISHNASTAGYYDDQTGAFQNLSLISQKAMQVWVDYDGQSMELNVTMAPLPASKRPKTPLLSSVINLSMVVTDLAYVGFSSATGVLLSYHYVLGWSFNLNGVAPALNYSKLPKVPSISPKHGPNILEIMLPVAISTFILAVATSIFLFIHRHFKYAELREDWEVEFGPHRFSYKDLFCATSGFKDKQLLGVGGFGRVYKGVLPTSMMEVAVKKVSHESRQGMKEFIAEIVSIGCLRHRNLVQLLGYSRRKGELLLVYDYMPNGSLDKYLYDQMKPALDWSLRFRIIKGIASALLYLHEDCEQVIIHRDIKASNVLLDSGMDGRLGDFGLAKLYDHGADPQTTHVVGTLGYLAPELTRTGRATPVTDVFAFGAFLLEVTCGRRPIEKDAHDNGLVLVDWVLENWRSGSITDTVDPRLGGEYVVEEANLVLKLGLLCSHPLPSARPSMRQLMQYLDGDVPLPELSSTYLSFSMLALIQNEGFDSYIMSYPSSMTSIATMSDLSGSEVKMK